MTDMDQVLMQWVSNGWWASPTTVVVLGHIRCQFLLGILRLKAGTPFHRQHRTELTAGCYGAQSRE